MLERLLSLAACRHTRAAAAAALLGLVLAAACSNDSDATHGQSPDAGPGGAKDASAEAGASASGSPNGGSAEAGAESSAGGSSGSSSVPGAVAGEGGTDLAQGGSPEGGSGDVPLDTLGGMVSGPHGASMIVPKGALTSSVSFEIAEDASGAPSLPAGMLALGAIYAFTPHGTEFAKPVTVQVPFDAASVPSDVTPVLLQAEPGGAFTQIPAQVDGTLMTATVSSLSWFVVARDGTHGTLLVEIGGRPTSGAGDVQGFYIRTGPAGSVYVMGRSQDVLDDTYTGPSNIPANFVGKLTTTLGFEWVRQQGLFIGTTDVAVGPTGNVYFGVADSTGNLVSLQSLNPSGTVRAGFPVQIKPSWIVTSLLVDGQDNPSLFGWYPVGATAYTSRVFVGSFTSSGKVNQAITQLSFGPPVGNSYTTLQSAVTNSAGLFFAGNLLDVTSENDIGTYVQHLNSNGAASAGFPIVDSNFGGVNGLVALAATSDVVELVHETDALTGAYLYVMYRYHQDGSLAAGFPRTLDTGSSRTITDWTRPVSDGQGNVYFVATLALPVTDPNWPDHQQRVLSYTSDGALRAGYPMLVGPKNLNDPIHPSKIVDMAVDVTGTMYFTGYYDEPVTHRNYLTIERLPAH